MTITRLVTNGCSYMRGLVLGDGHIELARCLGIDHTQDLSLTGSCNSRIIRTTLKDSFTTSEPSLYIIGLSFFSRSELPVARAVDKFEGAWISFQNQSLPDERYNSQWTKADSQDYLKLRFKYQGLGLGDIFEDLAISIISMINDLVSRGHNAVVFNQVENLHLKFLSPEQLDIFNAVPQVIDRLRWAAVPWQFQQGVAPNPKDQNENPDVRHPATGEHQVLNKFLIDYIRSNNILK